MIYKILDKYDFSAKIIENMKKYKVKRIEFKIPKATAITSMVLGDNGLVYVGLTGISHVLVELNPKNDEYRDLGEIFPIKDNFIELSDKIHNSLVKGSNGILYIGQGLNIDWNAFPIEFNLSKYEGGHMFSFDTKTGKINDLGLVVPLNAIHGLTIDKERGLLYGYTIPDNHFFIFDIFSSKTKDLGKISQYSSHNLICLKNGNVYSGWFNPQNNSVYLLKYDFNKKSLIRTKKMLVYNVGPNIQGNIGIDSWIETKNNEVYCGTVDGCLLKLGPKTDDVKFIGKPLISPRISGIVEGKDGLLYLSAGFPVMHLVSFNPRTNEFEDFGEVETQYEMCYFHGMTILDNGTIYVGETDSERPFVYKLIPSKER
jgi:hypothetical protein